MTNTAGGWLPAVRPEYLRQGFAEAAVDEWILRFGYAVELAAQWYHAEFTLDDHAACVATRPDMHVSEAQAWRAYAMFPDALHEWVAGPYDPHAAAEWSTVGARSYHEADAWEAAGGTPDQANTVTCAGTTLIQALLWTDDGIALTDVTDWHQADITDRAVAVAWHRANLTPEDAQPWLRAGITDPATALQWAALEVRPSEAARFRRAGLTPEEVRHRPDIARFIAALCDVPPDSAG